MNFNAGPNKISSRSHLNSFKKTPHHSLVFNNTQITQVIYQKQLGIILDSKLIFEGHLKMVNTKIRLLDPSVNVYYKTYHQEQS